MICDYPTKTSDSIILDFGEPKHMIVVWRI